MGELAGHDGAPFLRRERDRSLSHRRLAQGRFVGDGRQRATANGVPHRRRIVRGPTGPAERLRVARGAHDRVSAVF